MSDILIKNACIIENSKRVIPDGFVFIEGHIIKSMGPMKSVPRKTNGTLVIDGQARTVLPGFINPHMHLYSQFAKGITVGKMTSFGEILKKLWWKLDAALTDEDVYYSGILGLLEAIKSGVTTVIDHHASYGSIRGSLFTLSRTFLKTGVRGCLCFEISDRFGKEARNAAIGENVLFVEECVKHRRNNAHLLRGMIGLHASMTLSDETLSLARKAMDAYGVSAHVHVAEGPEDVLDAREKYKKSVVRRLFDEGILRENAIAAHCIHVDDKDLLLLKKSGAFVVHNPVSNLNNAVGIAPFLAMHQKKIPVGIGTDGMSAGIFTDVKVASVIHKLTPQIPPPPPLLKGGRRGFHGIASLPAVARNDNKYNLQAGFGETCCSALQINPQIASQIFRIKTGVLEEGAFADVIISDYVPITPIRNNNICGHILFGVMNAPVRTTICNGRILMQDFKILCVDEEKIAVEAKKCAKKLWNRL
jgi:putative selenium metabolism protein SsnA